MVAYSSKTKFGTGKLESDNVLLCDTRHEVWAYYTDNRIAYKDYIIIGFRAKDTSGFGTGFKENNLTESGQHKIRVKIYNDGKKVYESDLQSGKGVVESQPFLINNEGIWEVKFQSIATGGECKIPSGTKTVGDFTARPPPEQEERTLDDRVISPTKPEDNWLLYGVLGLFIVFGIKKIKK